MSSKFRYSPSQSSSNLPTQNEQPKGNKENSNAGALILPEASQNATVDYSLFGSFAGPIPGVSPQPLQTNHTNNNNNNNNNKSSQPVQLRLIQGNRVNIPPKSK